ncbi:microtubule-associated protein 9 [Nematolebias whitei]|uniref:microtubule-associated protein 9 n=1 Tax=Nematolebias whitei TaxID=451745 RepID=UPI00189922DD|nr:microtubule-associated protein 9 [Nematolebias whitei]
MTDQEVTTLAYSKSPKTLKRTTFQDELQAAVSSRASRTKAEQLSNFNNIDEEDEFFNKLLRSKKSRIDAFKAGKAKAKLKTFDLSDDDEDKHSRPKKVSFLKSQRSSSDSKDKAASEAHEDKPLGSSVDACDNNNGSFSSQHSTNEENTQVKNSVEFSDPQLTTENTSQSSKTSDDTLPLPPTSGSSVEEAPGPTEQKRNSVLGETFEVPSTSLLNNTSSAEREPPKPKPRQRTLGLKPRVTERTAEETAPPDLNGPLASSVSAPLSDAYSSTAQTDGDHSVSPDLSKSSSNKSKQSQLATKSTLDSGSRDAFISDDSKEAEKNYSLFEEFNGCSRDTSNQLSHAPDESLDTMTSTSSTRSHSACSKKVESKYLGALKVLDRKVSLQESQPKAADSVRAAVYQEWLKKKREASRRNIELKKKEQRLKEKEQQEQESKKEDVDASYEAWKEKKTEILRAKAKERNEKTRKEQKATEEKQEKIQCAKQVFEKWKEERGHLLREKRRQQKEAEDKLQLQKQEQEEEKKQINKSAFSDWCEKKKDVLRKDLEIEREQNQSKAKEKQCLKEERDKMALEKFESWLTRKDQEQKKRWRDRQVQAIIQESPPPPWSPPNKTVPFGK